MNESSPLEDNPYDSLLLENSVYDRPDFQNEGVPENNVATAEVHPEPAPDGTQVSLPPPYFETSFTAAASAPDYGQPPEEPPTAQPPAYVPSENTVIVAPTEGLTQPLVVATNEGPVPTSREACLGKLLCCPVILLWLAVPGSGVTVGVLFWHECPLQPRLPLFLVGFGATLLTQSTFLTSKLFCNYSSSFTARMVQRVTDGCLSGVLVVWYLLGLYWTVRVACTPEAVFSQHTVQAFLDAANDTAIDDQYCNRNLYDTSIMFLVAFGILFFVIILGVICIMFYARLTPRWQATDTRSRR